MFSLSGIRASVFLLAAFAWVLRAQVLTLSDGYPVRLQLMQTVSSAEAHVGQTIDFEVSEPLVMQGLILIPKGSVALGKVIKSEPKRRFGRSGALEISIDSVRLADGSRAALRAEQEKGTGRLGGGRVAATVAVSPVLVWVKGKDVAFPKGTETTAYINGDARLDAAQLRQQLASPANAAPAVRTAQGAAERTAPDHAITNMDILAMEKGGIPEAAILTKIANSTTDFHTSPQDLVELKQAGVSDAMITAMVQKSEGAGAPNPTGR